MIPGIIEFFYRSHLSMDARERISNETKKPFILYFLLYGESIKVSRKFFSRTLKKYFYNVRNGVLLFS